MIHFIFYDKEPRYLFLKYDSKEDEVWLKSSKKHINLTDHINLIDPICYLPSWGNRIKITQDFLFEYVQPTGQKVYYCAIGLWQVIYKFFKENNVEFDGLLENQNFFKLPIKHSFEEFKNIVDSWGLDRTPRPYQYECAYKILQYKQSVSQLATRGGKTLLAYIVFRYAYEYMGVKKILMIVPSIQLVQQGYNDFNEYAEFFKTECIWGGGKLVESSNLTIGTFQSLIKFLEKTTPKHKPNPKYNPSFFDDYDLVFVDETHRATAEQIKTIISQPFMKNVKLSFGMTGTLPKPKTIEYYCLHSLLGAKIQEIRPKKLMDEGYISDVFIKQVQLNYIDNDNLDDLFIKCCEYVISDYVLDKDKKGRNVKIKLQDPQFLMQHVKKLPDGVQISKNSLLQKYKDDQHEFKKQYIKLLEKLVKDSETSNMLFIEKMMTHFLDQRIEYLCNNILPSCDKNTLILSHHTEYIKYYAQIIKERFPNRHIDIITGAIRPKKREQIKQMLKDNNDCILIASYGCMSTGITLSNLCYGILFESFKSEIINMQSIGRGLGLSDLKDKYILYDIIDCFPTKKLYLQALQKIKMYNNEEYPYTIIKEYI